jgi:hypothetical protein
MTTVHEYFSRYSADLCLSSKVSHCIFMIVSTHTIAERQKLFLYGSHHSKFSCAIKILNVTHPLIAMFIRYRNCLQQQQ